MLSRIRNLLVTLCVAFTLVVFVSGCDAPEKPSKMVQMRGQMEQQRKEMSNTKDMTKVGPGTTPTKP